MRLWDSQWMNVVNTCKPSRLNYPLQAELIEDLVSDAIDMTVKYIAENVAAGALPPKRT